MQAEPQAYTHRVRQGQAHSSVHPWRYRNGRARFTPASIMMLKTQCKRNSNISHSWREVTRGAEPHCALVHIDSHRRMV